MIRKLFKEGNKSLSILVLIFVIVMAAGGILLEDDFLLLEYSWYDSGCPQKPLR